MTPIEVETERFRKAILGCEWEKAQELLPDYHRSLVKAFQEASSHERRTALRDGALDLVRWARRAALVDSAHYRAKRARIAAANFYLGAGSPVTFHSWKLRA